MVWRGHNSGIYHLNRWDWRSSQRDRLDFLANDHSEQMVEVLVDVVDSTGVEVELWSRDELAKKYLDVGLIGGVSEINNHELAIGLYLLTYFGAVRIVIGM